MKPTLVIMAAGMGSRYGGLKQIDPVGPGGERIIDYSLFDAIGAGFGKVVFIIRRDIEKDFREAIEPGLDGRIPVEYVFQESSTAMPRGMAVPVGRTKPWGTGHAILCCRDVVHEPFGVINADDFYGRDGFDRLARGLASSAHEPLRCLLVGYRLGNTLSPHGSVSRGVCRVGQDGRLMDIIEKTRILHDDRGSIVSVEHDAVRLMSPDDIVSMNMWGFHPEIFPELDAAFSRFIADLGGATGPEFFISSFIDIMIKQNKVEVMVVPTSARWMGMTYPEDRETVCSGVASLIQAGQYSSPLWPDDASPSAGGLMQHDGKTEKARDLYSQPHQS